MADQKDGAGRLLFADQVVSRTQISEELVEKIDVDPAAGALPVTPIVESPAVESSARKMIHDVSVSPRVLGEAVYEEQGRDRLLIWNRMAPENAVPVVARSPPVDLRYHVSSFLLLRT
jgi:hypothetical protein